MQTCECELSNYSFFVVLQQPDRTYVSNKRAKNNITKKRFLECDPFRSWYVEARFCTQITIVTYFMLTYFDIQIQKTKQKV